MNPLRRVLQRLAAAVALAAIAGCAGMTMREPLNVSIAALAPAEMGLLEQRYAVTLRLQNPNDTTIPFDGMSFEIELNGKSFAKGVSDAKGTVPRFGETTVDLMATSQLAGILRQITLYQAGDKSDVSYRVRGRLNTPDLGGVSFSNTGEIKLPGVPK